SGAKSKPPTENSWFGNTTTPPMPYVGSKSDGLATAAAGRTIRTVATTSAAQRLRTRTEILSEKPRTEALNRRLPRIWWWAVRAGVEALFAARCPSGRGDLRDVIHKAGLCAPAGAAALL